MSYAELLRKFAERPVTPVTPVLLAWACFLVF